VLLSYCLSSPVQSCSGCQIGFKPVINFGSYRGIARQAITTTTNSNFAAVRLASST